MTTDNPYKSSPAADPVADQATSEPREILSGQATYNVVSDTVAGLDLRKRDNTFQALFILAAVVLLAVVGAVLAALNGRWELPWYGGALFGGLAGLVIGLFASGIFLMIYRAVQHIKGKHN